MQHVKCKHSLQKFLRKQSVESVWIKKVIIFSYRLQYGFSEFATPSCKRGKAVSLLRKSQKFGPLVCGTACILISHVYVFFITIWLWFIIQTKVKVKKTRLWKDILHRSDSYCKSKGLTVKVETKYLFTNWFSGYHFCFP